MDSHTLPMEKGGGMTFPETASQSRPKQLKIYIARAPVS